MKDSNSIEAEFKSLGRVAWLDFFHQKQLFHTKKNHGITINQLKQGGFEMDMFGGNDMEGYGKIIMISRCVKLADGISEMEI